MCIWSMQNRKFRSFTFDSCLIIKVMAPRVFPICDCIWENPAYGINTQCVFFLVPQVKKFMKVQILSYPCQRTLLLL